MFGESRQKNLSVNIVISVVSNKLSIDVLKLEHDKISLIIVNIY
jgi:hypothetical protein